MVEPRVLISIDYESWTGLSSDYQDTSADLRHQIDNCYVRDGLDEFLSVFKNTPISIYLLGEIALWYPEIPEKISANGHELGFHGHFHRPLLSPLDLEQDIMLSLSWIRKHKVRAFRAPILRMSREAYPALANAGFKYSSSVYGPTGNLQNLDDIWEIPVSTFPLVKKREVSWWFPRDFTPRLFSQFEFPYGSSMMVGMIGEKTNYWIERELKEGRSPVIVLHNYQLVSPEGWPRQVKSLMVRQPWEILFTISRLKWVEGILSRFPIGTIGGWLDETLEKLDGEIKP